MLAFQTLVEPLRINPGGSWGHLVRSRATRWCGRFSPICSTSFATAAFQGRRLGWRFGDIEFEETERGSRAFASVTRTGDGYSVPLDSGPLRLTGSSFFRDDRVNFRAVEVAVAAQYVMYAACNVAKSRKPRD